MSLPPRRSLQFSLRCSHRRQPNQALKLTRRAAYLLGGPASREHRARRWPCTSSAVQLNAGVRLPLGGVG
jgi:hypothetical protein